MTIPWADLRNKTKPELFEEFRRLITVENYLAGDWTLTEAVQQTNPIKFWVYRILDGVDNEEERTLERLMDDDGREFRFRLKVLSRFACCEDKKGRKIYMYKQAVENSYDENSFVPDVKDLPKQGDIVEWKGKDIKVDPDTGKRVDARTFKRWAYQGQRPNRYNRYTVDKDLCIRVPYPDVIMMLNKHGVKCCFPRFKKKNRGDHRMITNWYFQEVPIDYTTKKDDKKMTVLSASADMEISND